MIRAWLVPADETKEMKIVEGPTLVSTIREFTDIDFISRVVTQAAKNHDFVGWCDDDGRQKGRKRNYRAQYYLGYPEFLVGDWLFTSERFVDDPDEPGVDAVSLTDPAQKFLEGFGKVDFYHWLTPAVRAQSFGYDGGER